MAGKLMRAVQYSGYGGGVAGLKHVEVPIPDPKNDEVLIKLEAASLNAADWKFQKGIARPVLPRRFPTIPGTDVAGEVIRVGSGVTKFKPGDQVVAFLHHFKNGALAEYSVSKETLTVTKPPQVPAADAAGLTLAGLTAYDALTRVCGLTLDGTTTGHEKRPNILVTAASGGVGHLAVQLAKLANAHVTATCGARNVTFVSSLGADEVLDYKTPEGRALTSPSGKKYDFVVDCAGGFGWSVFKGELSEKGRVLDLAPGPGSMCVFAAQTVMRARKRIVPFMASTKAEDLESLLGLVRDGKLKVEVDSRFGLSRAEEAWERIMSGHATGKVIVEA